MRFIIPGEPQGKARARTFYHKQANKIVSMTPEKTVIYENLIKIIAREQHYEFYWDEPLSIKIIAYYGLTKTDSKSKTKSEKMILGDIRPTKKPDVDNILKVICDALNGIIYKDDVQIVSAQVEKWYSDYPRVTVEIEAMEGMK